MPTVQQAVKMWSRQSSDAVTSDNFRKFELAFTEAYQIVTSYDATELDVYTRAGLPSVAQPYPGTDFVLAERANLQRVSPIFWIATVNYRGEIGSSGLSPDGTAANPIMSPPRITWDDVETEEEIDEDFDGNPIRNSAGDRMRGVRALFSDQTLSVTRNFATFNTYIQAIYRRSVNSDTFMGWPPGTCKLMKLSAQNVVDQNTGYWQVTGVFQFRYPYRTTPDKSWYARVANMGLYQKTAAGIAGVPCLDANKYPATTPQYLKESGEQIDIESLLDGTESPHWLEFKLYGSLPYNALGLI